MEKNSLKNCLKQFPLIANTSKSLNHTNNKFLMLSKKKLKRLKNQAKNSSMKSLLALKKIGEKCVSVDGRGSRKRSLQIQLFRPPKFLLRHSNILRREWQKMKIESLESLTKIIKRHILSKKHQKSIFQKLTGNDFSLD